MRRFTPARLSAAALALFLAGCQSSQPVADALGSAAEQAQAEQAAQPAPQAVSAKGTETLGKGLIRVALLLPLAASGPAGERAKKVRDGAALAMSDLGSDLLTLQIADTAGDEARATKLANEAISAGSRLLIGPSEPGAIVRLASMTGPSRPVVLSLSEHSAGSPGVYAMQLSEADSAAAGAGAVAAQGARKFVLIVAEGGSPKLIERRVANAVSAYGGSVAVTVTYRPSPEGAATAAKEAAALVSDPDAIVVATGGVNPALLVETLRQSGVLKGGVKLVGTNRWPDFKLDDPALQGAHMAVLEASDTAPLSARFRSSYGYEPDVNVAIGYDSVALAAGVASAMGPKGFTRQVFENPQGFRGSTGRFQFRSDGGADRSVAVYQLTGGKLRKR